MTYHCTQNLMLPWQLCFEKHYARYLSSIITKPDDNLYKSLYGSTSAMFFFCFFLEKIVCWDSRLNRTWHYLLKLHNIHILGSKGCMYNVVFVKVLKRGSYLRQESDYEGLLATSIENILLQVSQRTCHWNLRTREDFDWTEKYHTTHTFIKVNGITEVLRALWLVNSCQTCGLLYRQAYDSRYGRSTW